MIRLSRPRARQLEVAVGRWAVMLSRMRGGVPTLALTRNAWEKDGRAWVSVRLYVWDRCGEVLVSWELPLPPTIWERL